MIFFYFIYFVILYLFHSDQQCSWLITANTSYNVFLNIISLQLELPNDVVSIYDGEYISLLSLKYKIHVCTNLRNEFHEEIFLHLSISWCSYMIKQVLLNHKEVLVVKRWKWFITYGRCLWYANISRCWVNNIEKEPRCTQGWKVEKRRGNFGKAGLNNWSISKVPKIRDGTRLNSVFYTF